VPSPTQIFEQILEVDGAPVRLAGTAVEGAPSLLFLHGAGMDRRVWRGLMELLAGRGVAAWAPDFPAHGGSGGSPLTTISDLAAWVIRLADALRLQRFLLGGHSMGALVALEAAAALGERAAGLALMGASPHMPVNEALLAAAREDLPQAAAMISGWGYGPAAQADGRAEAGRGLIQSSRPGVLAADLRACADYAGAPIAAKRVGCAAVVIAGAKDRMTPAKRGRGLAEAIAGASYLELPEVSHMLPEEAPEALAEALRALAQAKGPDAARAPGPLRQDLSDPR
jgi:pimeloyl-ACP methyl ester carboxylesterase